MLYLFAYYYIFLLTHILDGGIFNATFFCFFFYKFSNKKWLFVFLKYISQYYDWEEQAILST